MTDTHTYSGPESHESDADSGDEWLGIGAAAARLNLSVDTLRRYDESGRLKASRSPGGQRRYRRSQIEAAMRSPQSAAP